MVRTESEQQFENFCDGSRISLERVITASGRTPDYDIVLRSTRVVVEVKEITPNTQERDAERKLLAGETVVTSLTPGQRVRSKIADAVPQLKARARGEVPAMLVLYDRGLAVRHLGAYQIRVAMYGFETMVFAVPPDPRNQPYVTDIKYGARKKTTPNHNTSLSAIGVLHLDHTGSPKLRVFHNCYAALPLPFGAVAHYGIPQYRLVGDGDSTPCDWQEICITSITS